jgi:hypothetical protein
MLASYGILHRPGSLLASYGRLEVNDCECTSLILMLWKPLRFGQLKRHQYQRKQHAPADHGIELLASSGYPDDSLADLRQLMSSDERALCWRLQSAVSDQFNKLAKRKGHTAHFFKASLIFSTLASLKPLMFSSLRLVA